MAAEAASPRRAPSTFVMAREAVRRVSGVGFVGLMCVMLLLSWLDRRYKRRLHVFPPISALIPCYNDGASVEETIAALLASYDPALLEIIVIDDCSSDDSAARLQELARQQRLRLLTHEVNCGKALSLNEAAALATHDILLFIDADTLVNERAMRDMLARLEGDAAIGAVSCPYSPCNHGPLPRMQAIEYNMLLLTQGAYNLTSALALWGGCLMARRPAFASVQGFTQSAITEDIDLAFKLNRTGWRVAQSFIPVATIVPQTVRAWVRQKLRWTSGSFQCHIRHPLVWLRNPMQLFLIVSYGLLTFTSILALLADMHLYEHAIALFGAIHSNNPLGASLRGVYESYGADILLRLLQSGICCLFSIVYVLPLVHGLRDLAKLLLVIPFALAYFPAYVLVTLVGIGIGLRNLWRISPAAVKGW